MVEITTQGKPQSYLMIYRTSAGLAAETEQLKDLNNYIHSKGALLQQVINLAEDAVDLKELSATQNISKIVVWRMDCFSGKIKTFQGLCEFVSDLQSNNIELVSVNDKFETSGLSKESFLRQLLELWGSFKKNRRIELARLNANKAKLKGSHLGKLKNRDDNLIRKLRDGGHSIREIASMTGVSPSAVQRGLKGREANAFANKIHTLV